jgi:molybdenum cofactor cytidylyltransferase
MAANLAGIVLAAGSAKIHDTPKLTVPVDGQPLVRISASRLLEAGVRRVYVVTGAHAPLIGDALAGLEVTTVHNAAYASGTGSSIRAGVEAVPADAEGFVILPGDMPLVTKELVRDLMMRFEQVSEGIVVPAYQKVPGYPCVLDRRYRDVLTALGADDDMYAVLADHPHDVCDVHVLTDAVVVDIDDEEDYDAVHKRLGLPSPRLAAESPERR